MGRISKNSKFAPVLSAGAILYFAVQWLGASTMGGCRIFSSSANSDRVEFAAMVHRISNAVRADCGSGGMRAILFDDGDVVTPYIEGIADPLGYCHVVRSSPVTPFTKLEVEDCGSLLVKEFSPPQPDDFKYRIAIDPDLQTQHWIEFDRWVSGDGRYAFAIYRRPCATPGDRTE